MKYDDDELAEAAVLLAHHDRGEGGEMPETLKARLLRDGARVVAEARYSTTKAGALALSTPSEGAAVHRAPHAAAWPAWAGWIAAAACFAVTVYQWRARPPVEGAPAAPLPLAPAPWVQARDAEGKLVAELFDGARPREAELSVARLPASVAGEHYRVWIASTTDGESALAVGSFLCEEECRQRNFSFASPAVEPNAVRRIWITRNRLDDAWTMTDPKATVAEGHHPRP